ncbi:MAG: methylcrotonoyl-CoA carboxylase, partial [Gammaproteobacteria bacterium HGW-Gammaproteobacteria-14]
MTKIHSTIQTGSPEFASNREHNLTLRSDLQSMLERIAHGGGEAAEAKLRARGKLP